MRKPFRMLWTLLALFLVLAIYLGAQAPTGVTNGSRWDDRSHDTTSFDKQHTFITLSAVGYTEPWRAAAHIHGVYVTTTGSPSGCAGRLQGSADGTNFFDIDGSDETCTSNVVTYLVDKPATWLRYHLSTFTGGTNPTATISYSGF